MSIRSIAALVCCAWVGLPAAAQSVVNGSLSGPNNSFSLIPPGWLSLFPLDPVSTPDTEGATGPHEPYHLSPDGGTFVAGAHALTQAPLGIEGIAQPVAGFVPGAAYRLHFYQSNLGFGSNNVAGAWAAVANWQLYLDGTATGLFSAAMQPTTGSLPNNVWSSAHIDFTASAPTLLLGFGPNSTDGKNAFLGIDGIVLSSVPEPAGAALLCAGLALGAAVLRRRWR